MPVILISRQNRVEEYDKAENSDSMLLGGKQTEFPLQSRYCTGATTLYALGVSDDIDNFHIE